MGTRSTKGTTGDYRHYPPCYPKEGVGITIDNTDPVFPIISVDDQGGITNIQEGPHIDVDATDPKKPIVSAVDVVEQVQGSSHITVDNTDPEKPIVATTGLVDKVHGTGQIIVDNTDENNPVVNTVGLVKDVNGVSGSPVQFLRSGDQENMNFTTNECSIRIGSDYTVTDNSWHEVPFAQTHTQHNSVIYRSGNKLVLTRPGLYFLTYIISVTRTSSSQPNSAYVTQLKSTSSMYGLHGEIERESNNNGDWMSSGGSYVVYNPTANNQVYINFLSTRDDIVIKGNGWDTNLSAIMIL